MTILNLTHKHITWAAFRAYKENPIQRNTEDRAARAKHLHVWHPAHSVVWAAKLPNGEVFKIEGHTRAFIYQNDEYQVEPDGKASLHLYEVEEIQDVMDLYHIHNNRVTTKKAADFVYGTYRRIGQYPKTSWFLRGQNSSALKAAFKAINGRSGATGNTEVSTEVATGELMPELMLLDRIVPNRKKFSTGILIAALLTIRAYGEAALAFWDCYNQDRGTKTVSGRDGVESLAAFHKSYMAQKSGGAGGVWLEAGHSLGAFEQHQEKRRRKGVPEYIPPEQYLAPMRQAAE